MNSLKYDDPQLAELIQLEANRIENTIDLVASETHMPNSILEEMAHIAGLVAAKLIPSPVSYADFVSFTTFKTMMGGRGGVILCNKKYADAVDKAVFPGTQGTTAFSNIAGKATIAKLAKEANFINVQRRTLNNAKLLATELKKKGYRKRSCDTSCQYHRSGLNE